MTRDRSVDIAKGLGIILMVMGHAGSPIVVLFLGSIWHYFLFYQAGVFLINI